MGNCSYINLIASFSLCCSTFVSKWLKSNTLEIYVWSFMRMCNWLIYIVILSLTLFFPWEIVPRRLFSNELNIIRTFSFPPSLRNLLRLFILVALIWFPGNVRTSCSSFSLLLWGVAVVDVSWGVWKIPSFTSRPARRAVMNQHY